MWPRLHPYLCQARCELYVNARSIALEFGGLLLVATYAIGYALGDMRWLTGRMVATDPREQAAEAEAAEVSFLVEAVHEDAPAGPERQPPTGPDAPVNS